MEWLAKLLLSSALAPFINAVLGWQKQKLDAAGSHEARTVELAQKAFQLDKREAEINASVVIAEQGRWFTRCIRPLLGLAVVVVVWKILVYDKALGQWTGGHTDALDPNLWNVMMTIIIAYMGGRTAEKVADKIAGVFKK